MGREMVGDERTQESEEAKQGGGRETQMIKIVPTRRRRATSSPATASVVAKLAL